MRAEFVVTTISTRLVFGWTLALLVVTEIGVREAGLVDFPIYSRDDHFGYAPAPNQAGRFLNQNAWLFNNRGMGVGDAWHPAGTTDIVVIGNSIILGGNTYDQRDKVVSQIQSRLSSPCTAWPVAAGGWTTVNEYRFLERHPDIITGTDFFVWEVMAHQIGGLNPWTRDTVHPTERPLWATGYVVRKVLDQRFPSTPRFVLPDAREAAQNYRHIGTMLERLSEAAGRTPAGILFLYPDQEQLTAFRGGMEWLPDRAQWQDLATKHHVVLIDIASYPQWTVSLYRDGIHPTREGNAVLASILAESIRRHAAAC